jgi:hypothetical protein
MISPTPYNGEDEQRRGKNRSAGVRVAGRAAAAARVSGGRVAQGVHGVAGGRVITGAGITTVGHCAVRANDIRVAAAVRRTAVGRGCADPGGAALWDSLWKCSVSIIMLRADHTFVWTRRRSPAATTPTPVRLSIHSTFRALMTFSSSTPTLRCAHSSGSAGVLRTEVRRFRTAGWIRHALLAWDIDPEVLNDNRYSKD